jgi:urease accessory protein
LIKNRSIPALEFNRTGDTTPLFLVMTPSSFPKAGGRPLLAPRNMSPLWALFLLLAVGVTHAQAHSGGETASGFVAGFTHPLLGLDHIVAMVAVGLWGAFLGAPAVWLLPVIFPMVMAFGGALGVLGVPIPGIETGIALSGIVLGLLVLLASRPPLWVAAVTVGFFAVFHGHAHGTELPSAASPLTYSIGFVTSTGLLHLGGITLGLLTRWPWGQLVIRAGGGVIAGIGVGFLFHWL